MQSCPCGLPRDYMQCCGRFISGQQSAETPEELMRSRYTAYTLVDVEYIQRTMKPPAADYFNPEITRDEAKTIRWLGLEVIRSSIDNDHGIVEFIAHFSQHAKRYGIHEVSEFRRENGQWYYYTGKSPESALTQKPTKIGRNDACPCGSGKKFKQCCGNITYQ